jgi:hypothetical protein
MKKNAMLLAVLLASAPLAQAAESPGKPSMGHGGHDHAAMGEMVRPTTWTTYPLLKIRTSGESRDNMVSTAVPLNIAAGAIDAYSNNLQDENGIRQLPLDMSGARLDKPASGGFHWLVAREDLGGKVLVASTVYAFGERGAKDPTAMFLRQKQDLEIIPQPYPREHSRYRANESWKFLVRFASHPLSNQRVVFETQNGTRLELLTDAQGVLVVPLPDDFKPEEEKKEGGEGKRGMAGMQGSDFVLAAEYAAGGKGYLTAFNGSYGKSAYDKRSMALGLGFTLLGMIGAVPLLRQRKTAPKNGDATTKKEDA